MASSRSEAIDLTNRPIESLVPGEVILNNEEILRRIDELAESVAERYKGQKLLLVGLLNGADRTLPQLREALFKIGFCDVETQYMQVRTRGKDLESSGQIEILKDIPPELLEGKNVLLVDDIADTLTTFAGVANHFFPKGYNSNGLSSFATFSLLEKPAMHKKELGWVPLDFVGFKIPPIWVEGFGLDSFGYGRGNPNIVFGPTPGALAFRDSQKKRAI